MLPVAFWYAICNTDSVSLLFAERPLLYLLIPLLGIISASALAAYIISSRLLNLSLFGLLGYVEPVLLAIVAVLLGERIASNQWLSYVPIWLAVGLLAIEGVINLGAKARQNSFSN